MCDQQRPTDDFRDHVADNSGVDTSTDSSLCGEAYASDAAQHMPPLQPEGDDAAWPHQMVRNAARQLASRALTIVPLAATSSPSSFVYSPSGCQYSRLSPHSPHSPNTSKDGDGSFAEDEEATSGCRPIPARNGSAAVQIGGIPDDDRDAAGEDTAFTTRIERPWRSSVILAAAIALSMAAAYAAGYQSHAHQSSTKRAAQRDNDNIDNGSNPLYPYPNYPENYVPMPGTGRYRNGRSHPKIFVCITGQLPRLELANKINHLFSPWVRDHGAEFDVALVLTDTNHNSVQRMEQRDQEYYTVESVADELNALEGVTVLNSNVDKQAQNPILNPYYAKQRAEGTTMNATQVLERVQNHVRQFQSLAECHHHLSQSGTASDYDLIHRVREDSGYPSTPDLLHLHDVVTAHPRTILSSDCQIHGGINDRGSFVSPDAAFDYFVYPILGMYTRPLPAEVRNTEQFLMVTYAPTCRLVQTDSFHIFRLWETADGSSGDDTEDDGREKMEFSRSDLRCLEDPSRYNPASPEKLSQTKRAKFCHDYSDGYRYCIYFDKAGRSYLPGKPGLLRDDREDDSVSARINEDWVPADDAGDDDEPADGDSGLEFDILDIGWDGSAVDLLDKMLKMKRSDEQIAEKRAKRKKKRQDWDDKHKGSGDGDDDAVEP